ncbi:MAG TPA: hypothetical protein VLX92_25990, partial [Kofleriaceae bacterium]|nr:hypothetical protein [Kofleriaceae bacterium]
GYLCGRRGDGSVACFGANQPCAAAAPKPVAAPAKPARPAHPTRAAKPARAKPKKTKPAPPPPPAIAAVALPLPAASRLAFDAGLCVITDGGKLDCLDATGCKAAAVWPALPSIDAVVGDCAHMTAGDVKCWRDPASRAASSIRGVSGAKQLAASGSRACALMPEKGVACWSGTMDALAVTLE